MPDSYPKDNVREGKQISMTYSFVLTMKKAFLLVTVAILASAGNAVACKCALETQAFGYAARNSPLIFSGQLVSVTDKTLAGPTGTYTVRIYKFVPSKVWRGTKADTITLESGNNNCDVILEKGRYVIYTHPAQDLISCNRIIKSGVEAETQKLDQVFTRKRFK